MDTQVGNSCKRKVGQLLPELSQEGKVVRTEIRTDLSQLSLIADVLPADPFLCKDFAILSYRKTSPNLAKPRISNPW